MSSPDWWSHVQRMIRNHPLKQRQLAEMRAVLQAAPLTGLPRSKNARRTTEDLAVRGFSPWEERVYNAVEAAIAETRRWPDGALRLRLIELKYWRTPRSTLKEAAAFLCMGEATAKRWHGDFIRLVAKYVGFL